MDLETIRELWTPNYGNPRASLEWWNGRAEKFSTLEIPSAENSIAMMIINRENMVQNGDQTLDVGCGSGRFSFALEALGAKPSATDFSPEMIKKAEEIGKSRNSNVQFSVDDWHALDLKEKGWKKNFDLVLANMTPAVVSADTFLKLIDASRRWVLMVKPTKRSNSVYDELLRLVNAETERKGTDESLAYAFDLAWLTGGKPKLEYQERSMEHQRPLEEAITDYTGRISTRKELTSSEIEKIREYLEGIAVDDMIHETGNTSLAAIYWRVD